MENPKTISAEILFKEWRKDADYIKEFEAQRDEFKRAQRNIDCNNISKS